MTTLLILEPLHGGVLNDSEVVECLQSVFGWHKDHPGLIHTAAEKDYWSELQSLVFVTITR